MKMTPEVTKKLKDKIRLYNSKKQIHLKNEFRKQIFLELKPYITEWISIFLYKRGVFLSKEEVLSKSWDCFEYALKHFKAKKGITVPRHFYKYTNYFLAKENKKHNMTKSIEEVKNEIQVNSHCSEAFDNIDELNRFKNSLPKEYIIPFEDALLSLSLALKDRVNRRSVSKIPKKRYEESKKAFKFVIEFLVKR
jgi:hypothetical protein